MTQAASIPVCSTPPYEVRVGEHVLGELTGFVRSYSKTCILTDSNVAPHWLDALGFGDAATIVVPPGEASKSFAECERVLERMVDAGLDRNSVLVALGGGVIGDLGGLCASLFLRGIDLVA